MIGEVKASFIFRIVIPIINICACIFELIITTVVQFQMFGFGYAILIGFISAVYLYQGIQFRKLSKNAILGKSRYQALNK